VEGAIPFASSPAGAAGGNSAVRYLLGGAAMAVKASGAHYCLMLSGEGM
jgi:hypothetical protein